MKCQSTQLSAATALVQLLTEHPGLSDHMTWSISRSRPTLVGYVHDGGMRLLSECAEAMGGSIQAGRERESGGQVVRQHVLTATWRDVPVEVLLSLPVSAGQVAA